jgi:hypothetical protein
VALQGTLLLSLALIHQLIEAASNFAGTSYKPWPKGCATVHLQSAARQGADRRTGDPGVSYCEFRVLCVCTRDRNALASSRCPVADACAPCRNLGTAKTAGTEARISDPRLSHPARRLDWVSTWKRNYHVRGIVWKLSRFCRREELQEGRISALEEM